MCDKLHWFTGVVIKGPFDKVVGRGKCLQCHANSSPAFVSSKDFAKMTNNQLEITKVIFDDVSDGEVQYYCVECWVDK
jgi:nitrate reductase cytochrome c-type subunit